MSGCLWLQALYNPWKSPVQKTGAGSLSLFQGIFPIQGSNPGLHTAGRFFTSWATKEVQEFWSILLQWIFLTQELNQCLPHRRWILLPTELSGKPEYLGKSIAILTLSKERSQLFNTPSRFVIPSFSSKEQASFHSVLQSLSAVILDTKKMKSVTASTFSPSICHGVMGPEFFEENSLWSRQLRMMP